MIRNLNILGGIMFATGSLWFISGTIQSNTISLGAEICALNDRCSRDNLNSRHEAARSAGKYLSLNAMVASLGAGLACLRERKD